MESLEQPIIEGNNNEKKSDSNPVKEYRDNLAHKLKDIEDSDQKKEVHKIETGTAPYQLSEKIHRLGLEITGLSVNNNTYKAKINGKDVVVELNSTGEPPVVTYDGKLLDSRNAKNVSEIVSEAILIEDKQEKSFDRLDQLIANAEVSGLFK